MLLSLLVDAATADPTAPAIVSPAGIVSFDEWRRRAEELARGLRDRGATSVAAVIADPVGLLTVFCAASHLGVEVCAYPATVDQAAVGEMLATFGHGVLVTDRVELGDEGPTGVEVWALSDLPVEGEELAQTLPSAKESPLLVLTTGTTGTPKGARHDWRRLVEGVRSERVRPGSRWLLAYNLNQFAGIQVFLHALVGRAALVVPPSIHPTAALPFAAQAGVTHISATPTFWRFGLGVLPIDGWSPEHITLGGEAVPGPLLADLQKTFPHTSISQIYASTEAGSVVSVTDGRSGLPLSVLERDQEAPVQVRIVDGELQMRSRVGMLGYHGVEKDEAADGGWRATGDLVEIQGDRIVFVGRSSEVINVGGVKVHPLPIEEAATAVPGVVAARAYGRSNPVAGQIVVLDVVLEDSADAESVEEAIRVACSPLGAAQPRRIRIVEELEVRENKMRRR